MASDDDYKIISTPDWGYIAHPGGLGCTFFEKMWENQHKIAQVDAITGQEENYESLMQRCVRTAIVMQSKGVTQDDIITICSVTNMDICVPYIASLFIGAKPSALEPTCSLDDTINLLKQIKPKLVFVDIESVQNIEKATKEASLDCEIVVFGNALNHTPFSDFLQTDPDEDDFKPLPAKCLRDTAVISFTCGRTGLPKGVCLSHYSFILTSHHTGQLLQMNRTLSFASFLWITTLDILVTSVIYGGCRIVVPKFEPDQFWQLLYTYKPTAIFLQSASVAALMKTRRPKTTKLNLKMVMLTGGPVPEEEMKTFQQMLPEAPVMLGYAQTELNGLATLFDMNNPQELAWSKEKVSSSGTALPGFSLKIVDTETQELLGPNQEGELRIKTEFVMNGYYNIDSSNAWDEEGWLKTGDLAYYDEDGCFYIVGRQNSTIT